MILEPFPAPPPMIAETLTVLAILRSGDPDAIAELGDDLADLPRPWDPPTCPPEVRQQLWAWCDQVAAWINHDYAWRSAAMIPACWPHHPHIARELPVLACLRAAAAEAATPDLLEDWHRYALPYFLERLATRIGDNGCRTGRHTDWPAAARHDQHTSTDAQAERDQIFLADTNPPRPLRAVRPTGP